MIHVPGTFFMIHVPGTFFVFRYCSMGRPRRINAAVLDTRAVVWSTGEYQYDGSGNVKQVGSNEFVYDGLHRLVHGEVDDGAVSQDYVYDGLGNLVEITETSGVPETRTISVDHTTNRLSGGTTYDSVGNLTSWGGFNYSWRVTGEMRARTGPGINKWFGYDAGGERVMVENKTTGVQTYTLRNLDGKVLRVFEKDGATWTWTKDYVYRGDLLLASRDATGTLHFTLDHLGTPRYVLDQNGLNPIEHEYFGFGEEATTTGLNEPMKFTGHERDLEGTPDRLDDLDYMHARYYSPVLGRFLSVDPVGGRIGSSQSWNRYAYVRNNPVNLVDPLGEEELEVVVTTAIPQEEACFVGMCFAGDGEVASAESSYRTRQSVVVETDPGNSPHPLVGEPQSDTGPTVNTKTGEVGQASGDTLEVGVTRKTDDGSVLVSFSGNENNPLIPSPGISYDLDISISPSGSFSVTGSHDGFPSYNVSVIREDGSVVPLFTYDPRDSGGSPRHLFPRAGRTADEQGHLGGSR
jgi:RHS repeat-associated protein